MTSAAKILPFVGNVVRPTITKPLAWEPQLPDLHLLTMQILAKAKIINADLEEITKSLENPHERRSIEGGSWVVPPFCVWGLPRSNQAKGKGRKGTIEAPRLWFLGAPLLGVKASGLSMDFSESVANADDARWTHNAMRYIHQRGGYVYGGLWSTVRWAQGKGVDTSDFQRVAEYAMDHLAVMDPLHLTAFAMGKETARVQIKSIREAEKLITGIWHQKKGASKEDREANKADRLFVLDGLAHPEFTVLTMSHRGSTMEESLAFFKIFESTTQISGARGSQGWELSLTPVAVAMGIGQAAKLGHLVSGGQRTFDPEGVALLLGWVNSLKESERRLARHLLLSPGNRGERDLATQKFFRLEQPKYDYLLEPYYAAQCLGHHMDDDRRTRERVTSSMVETAQSLFAALDSLGDLPAAKAHLRKALETMGVGVAPKKAQVVTPSLGLDLEEDPAVLDEVQSASTASASAPESISTAVDSCHVCPEEAPQLPQMRDSVCPSLEVRLPREVGSTAPNARHNTAQAYENRATFTPLISSQFLITSFSFPVSQSITDQAPQKADIQGVGERRTDGRTEKRSLIGQEKREEASELNVLSFPSRKEASGEDSYKTSITLPPPSKKGTGRPENRTKDWPRPLKETVTKMLFPCQMVGLETDCLWTAEGVWAIYQDIKTNGARLSNPKATFAGALVNHDKASKWLSVGPRLREAGWFEVPEDGTPSEAPERRLAAGKLLPVKRLPLDGDGVARRNAILQEVAQKRQVEVATVRARDLEAEMQCQEVPSEAESIWAKVAAELQGALPERTFQEFIRPCRALLLDRDTLVVQVPSAGGRIWIEQTLCEDVFDALDRLELSRLRIQYIAR